MFFFLVIFILNFSAIGYDHLEFFASIYCCEHLVIFQYFTVKKYQFFLHCFHEDAAHHIFCDEKRGSVGYADWFRWIGTRV